MYTVYTIYLGNLHIGLFISVTVRRLGKLSSTRELSQHVVTQWRSAQSFALSTKRTVVNSNHGQQY